MHLYARNLSIWISRLCLGFCQTATIYCSGGKQLSKQASLATPLATGTAILHTESGKQKTAEQRQWKRMIFFVLF